MISLLLSTGCLQNSLFPSKIIYEASPTSISYEITYGYQIQTSGKGQATVYYEEYLPQIQNGSIIRIDTIPENYQQTTLFGNQFITWNQTLTDTSNQSFFVSAHILQKPIIIKDLSGNKSLTLSEIQDQYPSLKANYCKALGNDTQLIVNPHHQSISPIAQNLKNNLETENAFILGKHLFSTLKNLTTYEQHSSSQPQPAEVTCETGVGDCDDLTYFYLSLCRSIGIPCRYVKGYLISNATIIPHVWAELFVGKEVSKSGWIPVECAGTGSYESEIHNHYGIEDCNHLRLCTDDGTNQTFQRLNNPLNIRYEQTVSVNITRIENIDDYTILDSKQLIIYKNDRYFQ
jgi:hypothetical protein